MNKIISDLDKHAQRDDLDDELKSLLRKASNQIEKQSEYVVIEDKTYSLLAHVQLTDEQMDNLNKKDIHSNGMAVTVELKNSSLDYNNGFLQLATMALNAVSSNIKGQSSQLSLAPEISDYLIQLGPWMQSFTNTYTLRNGSEEIEAFDIETFERVPQIKLPHFG